MENDKEICINCGWLGTFEEMKTGKDGFMVCPECGSDYFRPATAHKYTPEDIEEANKLWPLDQVYRDLCGEGNRCPFCGEDELNVNNTMGWCRACGVGWGSIALIAHVKKWSMQRAITWYHEQAMLRKQGVTH